MKALVFNGPYDIAVEQAEDPKIEQPGDAIIRVTTANICGSNLRRRGGGCGLRLPADGAVLGRAGVEAVGFQAHDLSGQEHPALVLDNLVNVVRATGRIGVVGGYVPQDPHAAEEDAKDGRVRFDYGTAFEKGIAIGAGQLRPTPLG